MNTGITALVELMVDEDELKKRLAERAHKENRLMTPSSEVIENRIVVYKAETVPVAEYYQKLGKYSAVVGVKRH